MKEQLPIPPEFIERRIYLIRGQKVMLDFDLAEIYQLPTFRLNEAVKRNIKRFPTDFLIHMSKDELENWRSQFAISNPSMKMSLRRPPFAFTEHGVVMLSAILNSDRAIEMNIFIVRAFIELRKTLIIHDELSKRLQKTENAVKLHDQVLAGVVQDIQKIKHLPKTNAIGFKTG